MSQACVPNATPPSFFVVAFAGEEKGAGSRKSIAQFAWEMMIQPAAGLYKYEKEGIIEQATAARLFIVRIKKNKTSEKLKFVKVKNLIQNGILYDITRNTHTQLVFRNSAGFVKTTQSRWRYLFATLSNMGKLGHISIIWESIHMTAIRLVKPPSKAANVPTRHLYVSGVGAALGHTENDIVPLFSPYGIIDCIELVADSRFVFVSFVHVDSAIRAMEDRKLSPPVPIPPTNNTTKFFLKFAMEAKPVGPLVVEPDCTSTTSHIHVPG